MTVGQLAYEREHLVRKLVARAPQWLRDGQIRFDETVVASEIRSYKPAHKHWREFADLSCADPARYVHVAQSHFHDIVPATELGIPNVWINRLGERREPAPTRELPSLSGLADVLDGLVPEA